MQTGLDLAAVVGSLEGPTRSGAAWVGSRGGGSGGGEGAGSSLHSGAESSPERSAGGAPLSDLD